MGSHGRTAEAGQTCKGEHYSSEHNNNYYKQVRSLAVFASLCAQCNNVLRCVSLWTMLTCYGV